MEIDYCKEFRFKGLYIKIESIEVDNGIVLGAEVVDVLDPDDETHFTDDEMRLFYEHNEIEIIDRVREEYFNEEIDEHHRRYGYGDERGEYAC